MMSELVPLAVSDAREDLILGIRATDPWLCCVVVILGVLSCLEYDVTVLV